MIIDGSDKFGALSEAVNYYKYENEGVSFMCEYVRDYAEKYAVQREQEAEAKGRAEADRKNKLNFVRNLLKLDFSLDKALETADLDLQTYEKYLSEQ